MIYSEHSIYLLDDVLYVSFVLILAVDGPMGEILN
jgi:hypothetical protein